MPQIDFLTVFYSSIEKSCTFTIILIPTALTVATIQLARRFKTLALPSLHIMGPSFFLHGLAFILFTVTVHAEWIWVFVEFGFSTKKTSRLEALKTNYQNAVVRASIALYRRLWFSEYAVVGV